MKQFEISTAKPVLCHAVIYIRSGFRWGLGWKSPADKAAFMDEVQHKLPFGDFRFAGTDTLGATMTNIKDSRQFVRCDPMEIEYMGNREDLLKLRTVLRENKFSSFEYIGMLPVKDVYDMTKQELLAVFDKNKKIIKDNIREYITAHPGSEKGDVIDNVFESVRVLNTHDASYGYLWGPEETGYNRVGSVFQKMVKDKEIVLDAAEKVSLGERKRPLRPLVKARDSSAMDMGMFTQ